jgi:hypothetical protein
MQISFFYKNFLLKKYKIILLSLILILVFYRSPYIFLNGRFVAEEGSFWFNNTFSFGIFHGLTQLYVGSGYFNLWANLSSVVAYILPLSYAPLGTVYMALLVQLYLYCFVIFSESNFFANKKDRIVLSLIVLITPPMVASVWLNSLVSQVYFAILTILIFFQKDFTKNLMNRLSPVILFISGSSSIIPCIFFPFFLLKYAKENTKNNLINLVAIAIPTIFQSIIFMYVKITGLEKLLSDGPRYILSTSKFVSYLYNVVVKTFLGRDLTQFLFYDFLNKNFLNIFFIFILLFFIFIYLFKITFNKIKKDRIILYLILFFITQSLLVIYVSKFESVHGRYAVVPGILLIFIFYRLHQISRGSMKFFCIILLSLTLSSGAYEYKFNNTYPQFLECIKCPIWKDEVSKWKNDRTYQLKIWQYPTKKMSLTID